MIHEKLLRFQRQGVTLKKVGENPHFHSSYATLNEVLDKVKEPLNTLGVLIIQESQLDGLKTILLDTEDGSKVESIMPYTETSTAQKLGSNVTYLRRYSLVTLLGLGDEDDDGNEASPWNQNAPIAPKRAQQRTEPVKTNLYPRVPTISQDEPLNEDPFKQLCNCQPPQVAKIVVTKKPGPNQGREFYACPKPMNQGCGYFQWVDAVGDGKNGPTDNIEGDRKTDFHNGAYIGGYDANESNNDPR